MATPTDGTLPRSGKLANDAAKEAHTILVQAERGLTDSLAKPKVSNAKSMTGAFRSVSLRDATDRSVASAFAEFGEGAAEVRRLGDDGPGGKGVVRRLEGVAAMKQSRRERHESAVKAWETERDRVVDEALAGEAAALVAAFRKKVDASDAKIAAIMDPFAPDVVRGDHVTTLRETSPAENAEDDAGRTAASGGEADADADPAAAAAAAEAAAARARRAERDAAADAALSEMDALELRDAWYAVSTEFPARTHGIDTLESALTEASSRCSSLLAATFSKVVDALLAVAHLPRPEVERFALEETSRLNRSFLDDKRATAELARRLRAREVLGESARRDAWVAATARWRELRVEKAVGAFDAFLAHERVARPPRVRAAYEALAADQKAARAALVAHVRKMTDAFRAVVGGGDETGAGFVAAANASVSNRSQVSIERLSAARVPSLEAVVRWREGMDLRLDAWDAAAEEDVKVLEEATRDVDGDVTAALARATAAVAAARDAEFEVFDFEFERVRRAEEAEKAKAREGSGRKGEEKEETAAPGDGEAEEESAAAPPVPPWKSETLLDETCAPKAAAIAESFRAAVKRAREAVADRASAWRAEAGRLGAFLEDAARLRETHLFLAERSAAGSEEALASLRDAFASRDRAREDAFETARAAIAKTQTEQALAAAEARATSELDEIETGYRSFWRDATDVAEAFPANVRSHFDAYERRVCRLLRLVPNARRPVVRDARASAEVAGDAGPDAGPDADPAEDGEAEKEARDDAAPPAAETERASPESGDGEERDPALVAWDADDAMEEWVLEEERDAEGADAADAADAGPDAGSGGAGDDEPSEPAEPAEGDPVDAVSSRASPSDPGEPSPPPRERVATRGGASFAVWSDLVEHVASLAPGPEAAGEPAPSGDADAREIPNDSTASGTEAPPLTDLASRNLPGGFDASLALGKEDVAAPLLLAARDALLDDYEAHLRAELRRADARAAEETESAREALESRLMAHAPRYGALEAGDVGKRRAALRERRVAFERYLLGAARAAKLADERFAVSTEEAEKTSDALVGAVRDVELRLSATASAAALVIREKEAARAVAAARVDIESAFAGLRERAERNCEHVLRRTADFRFAQGLPKAPAPPPTAERDGPGEVGEGKAPDAPEAAPPESDAASPAPEAPPPEADPPTEPPTEPSRDGGADAAVAASSEAPDPGDDRFARLAAVDAAARKSLAEHRASVAEARERCLEALAEAERAFREAAPRHQEDLALLDLVRVATDRAASAVRKTHEEDARLKASLEASVAFFRKVARGRAKARDPVTHDRETTAEKVLETLASFGAALLKRCRALEIVDPALAPDHAEVAVDLDDPECASGTPEASNEAPGEAPDAVPPDDAPPETDSKNASAREKVSAALETARAAVGAAGEAYFAAKDAERASTRPDAVPESDGGAEALVSMNNPTFDALEADAAKRRDAEAAELRVFVAGLGATLGAALEATLARELELGLGSVAEAARAAAAETAAAARDVSARRSEHKDRMRPGIAHSGRELELAALLASERARAEDAARVIAAESRNVEAATRGAAARWARRLRRATRLAARFAGGVLVAEELRPDGPGAEAEQAARRKNLKQLRVERLKHAVAADAERRAASESLGAARGVEERAWASLDVAETAPENAPGYEPFDVAKALPTPPRDEGDGQKESEPAPSNASGEDATAANEVSAEGEDDAKTEDDASPAWAADAPAVRALMDARDRAWRDFTAACHDAYARQAAATARRVADEVAHRQVWDELVARAKGALR